MVLGLYFIDQLGDVVNSTPSDLLPRIFPHSQIRLGQPGIQVNISCGNQFITTRLCVFLLNFLSIFENEELTKFKFVRCMIV